MRVCNRYHVRRACHRLISLSQQVLTDASLPDELLFGRTGYLLALLFVRHHLGSEAVPQSVIRQVSSKTHKALQRR